MLPPNKKLYSSRRGAILGHYFRRPNKICAVNTQSCPAHREHSTPPQRDGHGYTPITHKHASSRKSNQTKAKNRRRRGRFLALVWFDLNLCTHASSSPAQIHS